MVLKAKKSIKQLLWGGFGGSILTLIIGFAWGGWVTGGAAKEKVETAVLTRLTGICIVQFNQDPEKVKKFKELNELDYRKREEYIKKQGWATMPGDTEPDNEVARMCSEQIRLTSE